MDAESEQLLIMLLRSQRTAALGTLHDGEPLVSMVLFAPWPDFSAFLIYTSRLSAHTGDLLAHPQASLLVSETDSGQKDPQTLARLTLRVQAAPLPGDDPAFGEARRLYLAKYPDSVQLFGLGDFSFFRLIPGAGRFVAGFARAFNLQPAALRRLAGKD